MDKNIKIVYPDAEPSDIEQYAKYFDRLRAFSNFEIFAGRPQDSTEYIDRVRGADGILLAWDLPGEVMHEVKNLRVVTFSGTGVAQFVDLPQARERGISVCNCPGYSSNTVAEHALALLLGVARHVVRLDKSLRQGVWNQSIDGFELAGNTIGLVGFGGIGQRFAQMCKAMDMKVLVWSRSMTEQRAAQFGVRFASLPVLYEKSDVISLHAAFGEDTENLIDRAAFAQMKHGVLFINTARAELVEESALIEALRSGRIAGAGLDVFWREPLLGDHPLLDMENVIVSPHVGYNTLQANDRLLDIGTNNLLQFFRGSPVNRVTE